MQLLLNELTLAEIGRWPVIIRVCLLSAVFVLTLCMGWQLVLGHLFESYQSARKVNENIAIELRLAKDDIRNIAEYELQIASLKEKLDVLERQLPDHHDTAGVLEALSVHAAACDLQFKSVKPGAESIKEK